MALIFEAMNQDLISIIMPVRNAYLFLEDCLQSIIAQSYSNWELIAVNDHSADASAIVLKEFSRLDSRIKFLENSGRGIIPALRHGYAHSQGQYITRMDADDLMHADKLELLYDALKKMDEPALSTAHVEYFSNTILGEGYLKYAAWLNQLCVSNSHFEEIYKECVIPSPCWMMRKADFEMIGGFSHELYPEDYDLCFRMAQEQVNVMPVQKVLHYWRDHPERASRMDLNYADNSFINLKLFYFLKLHHDQTRPLLLWGAGKKGKVLAKRLNEENASFFWLTNNTAKIGKHIYDNILIDCANRNLYDHPQYIVAIAEPLAQEAIKKAFQEESLVPLRDYFFFC